MASDDHQALLRMALTIWLRVAPATLSVSQRQWLTERLRSHAPLTVAERARVVPPLLAALEGYDTRCAAVARGHLAGEEDVPWRGARSSDGLVKVLTIVHRLQEAHDVSLEEASSLVAEPARRSRAKASRTRKIQT